VVWIVGNAVMQVVGVSTARTARAWLDRPRGRTPGSGLATAAGAWKALRALRALRALMAA